MNNEEGGQELVILPCRFALTSSVHSNVVISCLLEAKRTSQAYQCDPTRQLDLVSEIR